MFGFSGALDGFEERTQRQQRRNRGRSAYRKKVSAAIADQIHKEDTVGEISSGMTGDLSAAGVYIRADASLEVGSPVEFEIPCRLK